MPVIICQKYGWTYNEYMETPNWFIELIVEKFKIDSQKQNQK